VTDCPREEPQIPEKDKPEVLLDGGLQRNGPATVFVNPCAGRGGAGRKVAEVREAFARRKYSVNIVETESAEQFRHHVRAAAANGCETLVAMGGDGTLQLMVREIIGQDVRVGVIPAGGGNDFAAALGIPMNVQQAVDVIVGGKCRMVDVVRVHSAGQEALYLGGGGMGLDAEAVRLAGTKFVNWPGRLRYVASALTALRGFSGLEVEAGFSESDFPRLKKRVLLWAVLNTPTYGGGLRLAPGAQLDDGKLELVMIEMLRMTEVLALLPRLLFTGELKTKRMSRVSVDRVRFSAQSETWFHGDGELLCKAPVEIQVMHKALQIFAP
jgi:diacylglycerol kinase (ATP)